MPKKLTVQEALEACIEYETGYAYYDEGRYREKGLDGKGELPLAEQYFIQEMAETHAPTKASGFSAAHKKERLIKALQDGKMLAYGILAPYSRASRLQYIDVPEWKYLQLDIQREVAEGAGRTYINLVFQPRAESQNTPLSRKRGPKSRGNDIALIYEEIKGELSGFNQREVAERVQKEARERFGTDKGLSVNTIIRTLRGLGKFKPLKTNKK